jgi:CubicO group peptidase (beta-lactamase class C family)
MTRSMILTGALLALAAPAFPQQPEIVPRVDAVFSRWASDAAPGCAVAVARDGREVLTRAYGMADLEHDVPNTPATIFEAGSVSKQFTAAAIVLLVLDGRLSLDDDVRRYIPEIPDYGTTIRLRHLLTHTSGLRDWGSLAAIAGWSRAARTHTHDHVIDILSRQRALNFVPGAEYSYSNSGYNLLAVIVERVSGMSFAEFSRTRIFEPLGLTHTQWRDDYTRIVKGRASAYAPRGGGYVIDRPIENVHGNGGLLTTVADLLAWNEALAQGSIGGRPFVEMMHRTGVLNDGRVIDYASGVVVSTYRDVPEISHTGSTSGYRAFLARYPDQRLDVAVLCNAGNVSPGPIGRQVADVYLGDREAGAAPAPTPPRRLPLGEAPPARELIGTYYSPDIETTFTVEELNGALVVRRRPADVIALTHAGEDTFNAASLGRVRFVREDGRVTGLSVQQARVYDLRFERTDRQ